MFLIESDERVNLKYNNSSLLSEKDGWGCALFVLIVPNLGVVEIEYHYGKLNRLRIIDLFKKYYDQVCYYILTISADFNILFNRSDILFIKGELKSNFVDMLKSKDRWVLYGSYQKYEIEQLGELVDNEKISTELFTECNISFIKNNLIINNNNIGDINQNVNQKKYLTHPLYDPHKYNFITEWKADKLLFIGKSDFPLNSFDIDEIYIDTIESTRLLNTDDIKKYIAIFLWNECDQQIEEWSLKSIIQGIPIFTKFYKKGCIQFESFDFLDKNLKLVINNPKIAHELAYQLSKPYWEWNTISWSLVEKAFKSGGSLCKREYSVQYIAFPRSITDAAYIMKTYLDQEVNGKKWISLYLDPYLYGELVQIVECKKVKLYLKRSCNLSEQIVEGVQNILVLSDQALYKKDYTKNMLHYSNIFTDISIFGKSIIEYNQNLLPYSFSNQILFPSLCCKAKSVYLLQSIINGSFNDKIYYIDNYEFSLSLK